MNDVYERVGLGLEGFRILVEAVTDYAIYMLDSQGYITTWNAGAERFKGYSAKEIVGQHFSKFYSEEDRRRGVPASALKTARESGKFEAEGWRIRKDGSRFWAHVVIDPIRGSDGSLIGFAKITRDLTERREAQIQLDRTREELFRSQKLEAIGQLTGGIAHDFNNVLTAVLGSLELLQRRTAGDPNAAMLTTNAMQAARRGATLTRRMLAFARHQDLETADVSLAKLTENMREMLDRSLGAYVTLIIDVPGTLPLVRADPGQVEMALLNLALNARDAMPNGGPITIYGRSEKLHPENRLGLEPGIYVGLAVRDEGTGMDAQTLQRSVEPFFTTKSVGQGTGLGLSMVHGMASQLGGRLELESGLGQGTTGTLWLPVAPSTSQAEPQPDLEASTETRKLRVLAVDDDALVLLNTAMMLKDAGHTVTTAYAAQEALELLKGEAFDLLVTDQGMPGMTGLELIDAAHAIVPTLRAMIVTGYAELPPGKTIDLPRLAKPFREIELLKAVDRAMVAVSTT